MDQTGNIADKLRGPRRPWRALLAVGAIVLIGVAGLSISGGLLKPEAARPVPTIVHLVGDQSKPTVPQIEHKLLLTTHVAKSMTPPPPEPVYVAPPSGGGGGGGVNSDGSVSGPGCPPPYINSGGSCHPAICEVLDDGTEIPCAVAARVTRVVIG